jgi:polyribonucleotide nucleotidyltransferase
VKVRVEKQIGSSVFSLETGFLAKQAHAAVLAQYGETVVINAATSGPGRPGIDFFPLTCDYRERTAAAGKFPGGFIKRETRPSTKETLTSRLTDRPIRPLFPPGFTNEVQIHTTAISADRVNDPDVLGIIAASASLHCSTIPFLKPIGAVRVGRVGEQFIVMPVQSQMEESDLDLVVAATRDAICMIEGFARELPEDVTARRSSTPSRSCASGPASGRRSYRRRRRPTRWWMSCTRSMARSSSGGT